MAESPAAFGQSIVSGSQAPMTAKEKRAAMTSTQLRRHVDVRIAQYVPLFEVEPGLIPIDSVDKLLRAVNETPSEDALHDALYYLEHVQAVDSRTGVVRTCYRLPQLRAALLKACVPSAAGASAALVEHDDEETLLRAFRAIDRDGKGTIDADYLKQVMTELAADGCDEDIEEMIDAATDMSQGVVRYERFAAILASGGAAIPPPGVAGDGEPAAVVGGAVGSGAANASPGRKHSAAPPTTRRPSRPPHRK